MLKVIETGNNEFWVYNPLGGRGRHCQRMQDGSIKDKEHSMFLEPSPKSFQVAVNNYLERNTQNGCR